MKFDIFIKHLFERIRSVYWQAHGETHRDRCRSQWLKHKSWILKYALSNIGGAAHAP